MYAVFSYTLYGFSVYSLESGVCSIADYLNGYCKIYGLFGRLREKSNELLIEV